MTKGEKIKYAREAAGMTQEELGRACGTTKQTIYKYENDIVSNIPLDRLESIAKAVGVSAAYIMGWDSGKATEDILQNAAMKTVLAADFSAKPLRQQQDLLSLSDEAVKVARDYSDLDHYGKQAVRDLIGTEKTRCEDDRRFLNDTQLPPEPLFVNLYSEPSAAGIAVPTMGKDYVPYELKPGDPKGAAYAVRVQGDSMEPAFHDGDIAFVNHDALSNGDVGIFCVDGGTVIKQYYHDPLGMTYLFSLNRSRADADVLINPTSNQTVVCQGRVITSKRYPLPTGI